MFCLPYSVSLYTSYMQHHSVITNRHTARRQVALRRLGHQVTHQTNGNAAWQHLSTQSGYDLLLLDLDLPGISGIEIARRVRTTRYPGRILIASGRLNEAERRELDSLRIDGKLLKPFTPQELDSAIQTSFARRTK